MDPQNISHRPPGPTPPRSLTAKRQGRQLSLHNTLQSEYAYVVHVVVSLLPKQWYILKWRIRYDKKHRIKSILLATKFADDRNERPLMGHAHIVWVLLSAARIAVRALNYITSHVAEPVGVWNGLRAPASKPSNLLNSYMCSFWTHYKSRSHLHRISRG